MRDICCLFVAIAALWMVSTGVVPWELFTGCPAVFSEEDPLVVKEYIDKEDFNISKRCFGETVLFSATKRGLDDVMRVLLVAGANADETADGSYFAGSKAGNTPLLVATKNNSLSRVRILLDNGAKIDGATDVPPVVVALLTNRELFEFFLEKGAKVDVWNNKGLSPLAIASGRSDFDLLSRLLKTGVTHSLNTKFKHSADDLEGFSPLAIGILVSDSESESGKLIFETLLDNGAEIDINVVVVAVSQFIVGRVDVATLRRVLDVQATNNTLLSTVLATFIMLPDKCVGFNMLRFKLLEEFGVLDVGFGDLLASLPTFYCDRVQTANYIRVVKLLLDMGVKIDLDGLPMSLLHIAVTCGDNEAAKTILEMAEDPMSGIDISSKNYERMSPFELAVKIFHNSTFHDSQINMYCNSGYGDFPTLERSSLKRKEEMMKLLEKMEKKHINSNEDKISEKAETDSGGDHGSVNRKLDRSDL